jgi:hypothetical protein
MNFVVGALTGDGGVPAPSVIAVLEATYGGNCGARRDNTSNVLRASCNGLQRCAYTILAANIGDPVFGCKKDYVAAYTCSGDPQVRTVSAAPEAGWGSSVVLDCTY